MPGEVLETFAIFSAGMRLSSGAHGVWSVYSCLDRRHESDISSSNSSFVMNAWTSCFAQPDVPPLSCMHISVP